MPKYKEQKSFAKNVGVYLAGGALGVLAEKAVNDAVGAGQIPNPNFMTVTLSDVAMVTAELSAAYYLRKKASKRKKLVSKLLVGMATGTVASQAYEWGVQQGSWFALSRRGQTAQLNNNSAVTGKYGRTAPVYGNVGAYLKPNMWSYAPR